jgi:AcrR family transcriptional regulator
MGITERRQRQKDEVKASILQTAWQIVDKEGWQALSIRKIAEAIEYSAPVIYDHFENKEAILHEFTLRGFRKLNEQLQSAKAQFSDPARQLEAMAYAYWRFAFDNKEYYQLMYGVGLPTCETIKKIPDINTFGELIVSSIEALIKQNANKEVDAHLKFQTFWSMLHGLISINMTGKGQNREEINMMVLKDFLQGFLSGFK